VELAPRGANLPGDALQGARLFYHPVESCRGDAAL
jgi:hypothetical protein